MKLLLFLSALLSVPSLALGNEFDEERVPETTELDPPVRPRLPHWRPWPRLPQVAVLCTAVETRTNLVFQSAGRDFNYIDACRAALESAAQKCVSHFGGTFTPPSSGTTACEGDSPFTHTGWNHNCRISCGPLIR